MPSLSLFHSLRRLSAYLRCVIIVMQRGTISHTRPFGLNAEWMDGCLSHVEPLSSLLAGCLGMVPASDWPFSAAPQRAPSLPPSLVPSCALVFSLCLTPNWFLPLPWKLVLASSGEEETQVGMEAVEEEDVRASERARAPFGFGCTPSRPPALAKCDGQTEGAKNGIFAWPLAPSHFRPIPANGLLSLPFSLSGRVGLLCSY